jgi:hypothetical protein
VADVLDQLVPRCHERVGALRLEARGERLEAYDNLYRAEQDLPDGYGCSSTSS